MDKVISDNWLYSNIIESPYLLKILKNILKKNNFYKRQFYCKTRNLFEQKIVAMYDFKVNF